MHGSTPNQTQGRSPYDDVVPGEGPADPRGHQQLYDDRGRPINPETKRINRDIVRSHNEVMTVIGVAEPENGTAEAQAETARKHHEFEDRVGKRLSLVGGVLETAAIWGVNGMRQRILLYKPYSQVTFYGMFQLVRSEQSPASYFFDGLPSFLASTVIEQLVVPGSKKSPLVQYLTLYVRLHLAIYTFFQRTGIIPLRSMLPNWRFFIPGTSVSPIPLPTAPTSLRPRSLLQWMGALALGAAPFAGFYLYTKMYILTTRTLRFTIYQLLPRPYNANRRRLFRETGSSSLGADAPVELGTDEPMQMLAPFPPPPANEPTATPGAALRRQSTVSLRGSNSGPAGAPTGSDEFASDDEEAEIMGATLISFDVEATEATPENGISPLADDAQGLDAGNANPAANTNHNHTPPTVWSAELRPNIIDSNRPGAGPGTAGPHDLVYRENALMRLPAVMAADVLAVTPARLLMTPVAAAVWLRLARPYMARLGRPLEGVLSAPGAWWGACTARGLANLLGLELLLVAVHFGAWTAVMSLAQTFRLSEEEWNERVGDVAADGGEI